MSHKLLANFYSVEIVPLTADSAKDNKPNFLRDGIIIKYFHRATLGVKAHSMAVEYAQGINRTQCRVFVRTINGESYKTVKIEEVK